jgi:hypothetical protein
MANWSPPPSNECPQELICKEKHECQDLCKAREILIQWVKNEILGYGNDDEIGEEDGTERSKDVPPPLF